MLGSFHGLSTWIDRIVADSPEGGSGRGPVGSIRRLELRDGRVVGELLVAHDEPGRSYSYEFEPGEFPFPVRRYRATVHALPLTTDGTTFVEWYGVYDCDGDLEQQLGETFIGRYREFCADLTRHMSSEVARS